MIYLDANASSRLRPEISGLFEQFCSDGLRPGNPSSVHLYGQKSRGLLSDARKTILEFLKNGKAVDAELIFTSGGTEACNQMILGFLSELTSLAKYPAHIVSSSIEHPAVLEVLKMLERASWKVSYVDPGPTGIVAVEDFISLVRLDTALVNLMYVNNETGAVQPVCELACALRAAGYNGPIVSDCIQALGKLDFSTADLFNAGITAISVSAHKLGGLSGSGAIVVSKVKHGLCLPYEPILRGGPQEKRYRGGTENLFGALAFAKACELTAKNFKQELEERKSCRELLCAEILAQYPDAERITPAHELANSNTLMLRFPGCRGDDLVVALDLNGLAASTGSACSSGRQEVSHVLSAMGFDRKAAQEVVRFSLDWDIDEATVRQAAEIIAQTVRQMSNSLTQDKVAVHAT